jgi:putative two-component system response regulator
VRILVIDDDPEGLRAIEKTLGERFDCEFARDASAARQKLAGDRFDFILCDVQMQGEQGALVEELAAEQPEAAVVPTAAHPTLRQVQAAIDRAPVPIYVKDLDRRYLLANRVTHELLNLKPGEMLGRSDPEVLPPEAELPVRESDMRVLRHNEPCEREEKVRNRTFLSVKFPFLDEEGNLAGITGVSVDITAQHEAEQLQRDLATVRERVVEELRSSRQEAVERLARAIELHDPEAGHHTNRIARLASYLASQLGLDDEQILLLRAAAPMHDVGKIAVADAILLKPGPLTPEERSEMERHTEVGHQILAGSESELLQMAARIALTHHEWFDGSGYPRGLKGEEIPIEGRRVAVADVFDALLSDRPYRKAMSLEEAVEILRAVHGTQFDPEVVDVLLEHLEDAQALRD